MRTYFVDSDKNEHIIDLTRTTVHNSDLVEFHYSYLDEQKLTKSQNVFIRKLAVNISCQLIIKNGKSWQSRCTNCHVKCRYCL